MPGLTDQFALYVNKITDNDNLMEVYHGIYEVEMTKKITLTKNDLAPTLCYYNLEKTL